MISVYTGGNIYICSSYFLILNWNISSCIGLFFSQLVFYLASIHIKL